MQNFHASSLNANINSSYSPQKLSNSVNMAQRSKSRTKTQYSPQKVNGNAYTVHNEQKMKVYVKFKPPSVSPQFQNITYINQKQVQIERQSTSNKIYSYDYVFHESVGSDQVFAKGCMDVIDQMFRQGQNGLIFVYGHTGTGKTFTMGLLDTVDEHSKGIIPQSIKYIFKVKQKLQQKYTKKNGSVMQISLSFNEIYMDEVYDMLDFQGQRKLQIRQHQTTKQPYIQNSISIIINSTKQAYQLVNIGLQKRRIAEQKINKRSSRGHGLITLVMNLPNGKVSKLCFVDLAGSQRVKQSESVGKTLKEAVYINTSLSALEALLMNIDQQSVRIYRGNKLTRLLQPFMESGKIRLFVTSNYQNIQPLQFAKRCKGIKFMQKQVIDYSSTIPNSQYTARISNSKGINSNPQLQKQYHKLQKMVEKLQQQNKNLTQLFTNSIVILNKINKLVGNLLDQQNIHSVFSLADQYHFSGFSREVEKKINQKINSLQVGQQQIIQKSSALRVCSYNDNKDESINTSSISNPKNISTCPTTTSASNPFQLQSFINLLPNELSKVQPKLNQLGFNIFQSVKNLAALCEYRNLYKKEVFTYAIKEQLLQNKNMQLQQGVNLLVKYCRNSQSGTVFNKIIKQLKQIGLQIKGGKNSYSSRSPKPNSTSISKVKTISSMGSHTPKVKAGSSINVNTNTCTQSYRNESQFENSPISRSVHMPVMGKSWEKCGGKQSEDRNSCQYEYKQDVQLFSNHENNVNNINHPQNPPSFTKSTSLVSAGKSKQSQSINPARINSNSNMNFNNSIGTKGVTKRGSNPFAESHPTGVVSDRKSVARTGGALILIQDI